MFILDIEYILLTMYYILKTKKQRDSPISQGIYRMRGYDGNHLRKICENEY